MAECECYKNDSSQYHEDDAMTNSNSNGEEVKLTSSWIKRLGMLIPGNANPKDEMPQPHHGESSSHPTRRLSLSIEDVQNALRNMSSEAFSLKSNASSNDPPSILKSNMVYSPAPAVDTTLNSSEEATNNTVYMLRLLMMVDSFPVDDRVNLGLPAKDSLPNTLSFKPDPSSQIIAATNPHVNMHESKIKEEGGGEGEDCEQPLGSLVREADGGHHGHPQTSLTTLLTYKPRTRRACSPNNPDENVSTTSEPPSSPVQALQTLEALASRASNHSSSTHPSTATDGGSRPSSTTKGEPNGLGEALESTMLKYKPKGKNSSPNMSGLSKREVFDSFTTMDTTGTFLDTHKRCVPTLANRSNSQINPKTRNDSWRNLKGKSSKIDDTSTFNSTLKTNDIFPSTGTFRDSAKRHVRTISEPNQEWDIKPLSQPVMPSSEMAATPGPSGYSDSVSDLLNDKLLPSTGTFKDLDKRHVRLMSEPKLNEEWELRHHHVRNFSVPDSIGYNLSTNTGSNNRDMRVKSRQNQPEKQKNLFQVYMENKAKLESVQQKPSASVEHVASIPPKAVEVTKPAAKPKGELLVDWGDQGTDSEDDDDEENNGVITFVKNDSSRRISDITTQDDFDSDFDEAYDTEMRERIRSMSIPEEPSWMLKLDNVKSNEGKNDDYFLADEDEGAGTGEVPPPVLQRSESERTSASTETVKTSGKCSTYDDIIVETDISHVEMGDRLIRNMSAITLLELSDEELEL